MPSVSKITDRQLLNAALLAYQDGSTTYQDAGLIEPPRFFMDSSGDDSALVGRCDGAVIVAFRGTEAIDDPTKPLHTRLQDWTTDLQANLRTSGELPGMVHDGYARSLDDLWPQVQPEIAKHLKASDQLIVLGHSKGGGIAVLGAMTYVSELHYPGSEIQVITFGAPRCGNDEFASAFDVTIPQCRRYEAYLDVVTLLPPHSELMALIDSAIGNLSPYIDVDYASVGELIYIAADGVPVFNTENYHPKLLEAERLTSFVKAFGELDIEGILASHRITTGSLYQKGVGA